MELKSATTLYSNLKPQKKPIIGVIGLNTNFMYNVLIVDKTYSMQNYQHERIKKNFIAYMQIITDYQTNGLILARDILRNYEELGIITLLNTIMTNLYAPKIKKLIAYDQIHNGKSLYHKKTFYHESLLDSEMLKVIYDTNAPLINILSNANFSKTEIEKIDYINLIYVLK